MISIRSAAESHTGYVRTNNEDLAVVSGDLAAIADGMGGHLGGEVAARTAIEELIAGFQRDRTAAGLAAAVRRANQAIWRQSRVDRTLHGMGTTLTAAALVGRDGDGAAAHLALVNVGDSRAYKLDRSGDRPALSRLTEDHSVVEEMVRQGEITRAEAAVHPHRHVLTRALGIDSEVDMDIWDLEPVPGTRLLLCTDGLTDEVPEDEIGLVLAASADPREAARELVGRALGHGGMDNVTVVVIDVLDEGPTSEGQLLEMVPARSLLPDTGEDRLRSDVTQALPITRSPGEPEARKDPDGSPGGEDGVNNGDSPPTKAPAAPSLEEAGAPAGAPEATTQAVPVRSLLYDAELDEPAPDSSAPEATGLDGASLGAAATGMLASEGRPDLSPIEHTGASGSGPAAKGGRRPGRSMTVRGGPSRPDPGAFEHAVSNTMPTVLVPVRRLSKQYEDRVVTFRVFFFLVVLAALLGGVIGVVIWFQRSSYYVGLSGDRVSIYQGRPGGLLWFKPQLLETSSITTKNLLPNSVDEVRRGIAESSYAGAKQQVADLSRLSSELGLGPSSSTSSTGSGSSSSSLPLSSATSTTAKSVTTTTTKKKGAHP
ncbi:MAG: PP2C family protein-serine/threonine phosphatase [Acidimicrobiales bacterium]